MSKKSKHAGWPELFPAAFGNFAPSADGTSPFAESIAGGMDFMKAMMGGIPTSVPGFVVPTVDLDELDKRIKDLRAVESWLALNANMLKATIQGLDVQRNTIAALKSYGGAGTAMAKTLAAKVAAPAASGPDERKPAMPFMGASHLPEGWPMPAAMRAAEEAHHDLPLDRNEKEPKSKLKKVPHPLTARTQAPMPAFGAGAASANAWMSFLQDQFARVANAAIATAPVKKSPAPKSAKTATKKRSPRKKIARKRDVARRVLAPKA
jgi:hypothetical protein